MQVAIINNTLSVDSREIAQELGIEHLSLRDTTLKYCEDLLDFGTLLAVYEDGVTLSVSNQNLQRKGSSGWLSYWFMYNEDQATFVLTLSRNSEKVVKAKKDLVKSFAEAKKRLEENHLPINDLNIWRRLRDDGKTVQVMFQNACLKNGVPAPNVHDLITTLIVQHTAKTARELPLVAGDATVGLNHHQGLEQQMTINQVKLAFAGMSRRKNETYRDMVHRAVLSVCPE